MYTATSKDDFAVKSRLSLIERYIDLKNKCILDIGCGNGVYTTEIAKRAKYVIGIDCNPDYIHMAVDYAKKEGVKNVDFVVSYAETFSLKSKFDVAIMIEVLEHVEDEIQALRNIRQHLNEDGALVLFVPNKSWIFETHGALIGGRNISLGVLGFPFLSWAPEFIRKKYAGARIYNKRRLKCVLTRSGFEPLFFEYYLPPLDKINQKIAKILRTMYPTINKLPDSVKTFFSISIFCVAKVI